MAHVRRPVGLLAALFAAAITCAQAPPEPPLPSELKESIEVRLVTVDVVALDADEKTVADLTKDDFELLVDGKPMAIDTFDAFCAGGAEADPNSNHVGAWPTPKDLTEGTRRVVLAFDYLHLPRMPCPEFRDAGPCMYHTKALQDYQRVLSAKTGISDEEMMVVALTGGLRVEQPFTKDRQAVIGTLHRMEHDVSLWNGNFDHVSELPLFASLRALVTVLRASPGAKAVVLVSAGPGPGDGYQLQFDQLAAAASDAQVSIYTVDCMGLFTDERYDPEGFEQTGGPPGLAKLASLTGGRLTRNSNDYTVGYARARRDLGCRYTLGFYDHHPELDKQHRIEVKSRRAGVHMNYAARYKFPSKKERRTLALEAAYLVPGQFEGGGLRAHLFPLEPKDAKTWSAILAVDFPVELGEAPGPTRREFGVVLRTTSTVAHEFRRSITVERHAGDPAREAPRVTFVEPVTLPPGPYTLTAVLYDPSGETPFGSASDLTVPPIPKHEAILAGPILGRRRGNDLVVYGGGDAKGAAGDRVGDRAAFRPLLIDDVDRAEPLAALTHVCIVRPKAKDGPWTLARRLETADGAAAGSLADVVFRPTAGTDVQCERMFDELPVAHLKPGGYTFRAVLTTVGDGLTQPTEGAAPFAVDASVKLARP